RLHHPLEQGAEGGVPIPRERLERAERPGADRTEALRAADGAVREENLSRGQRVVEARAEHPRRVAQLPVPRPEPDAGRLRLVGINLPLVPLLPAPGEDRAQPDLLRDVLHGERLPLDDLIPGGGGLEAVAAADSSMAQEAEHEA